MILSIGLFSLSLIVYAFGFHILSKNAVKIRHALFVSMGLSIGIVVLFGSLNLLLLGALLFYLGALFLIVWYLVQSKYRLRFLRSFCQVPIVSFLFGTLFFLILFSIKEPFFLSWDEFSHWGPFVKNAKLSNAFHIYSDLNFVHPPYVQGGTALYYVGSFFHNVYAEADVYALYCVCFVVCAVSLFPDLEWKRSPITSVCFILATPLLFMVVPYAQYAAPYTSIYLDALTGVFFGAVLAFVVHYRKQCANIWVLTGTGVLLFALLQFKDICIAFFLIILATYVVHVLLYEKIREWKLQRWGILILFLIVLPLSGKFIWSTVLNLTENASGQFSELSISGLIEMFRADFNGETTWVTDVWNAFLYGLWNVEVVWTKIPIPLVALIIFGSCLLFGIVYRKTRQDSAYFIHGLLFVFYFFCYLSLLLVIYLCAMSPGESLSNASLDRYTACFLSGWCVVLMSWGFEWIAENHRKICVVLLAVCSLIGVSLFASSQYAQYNKQLTGYAFYESRAEEFHASVSENGSVWFAQYGENPNELLEKYVYKYFLLPNSVEYKHPLDISSYTYSDLINYAQREGIEYIFVVKDIDAFWGAYGADIKTDAILTKNDRCVVLNVPLMYN